MTRFICIIAALAGGALLAKAENWGGSHAEFFAADRARQAQQSPLGVLPNKIARPQSSSRLANAMIIEAAARREGIPPAFARRLVQRESGFNHLARSPVGAQGLTQVMPGTWRAEGCTGSPWRAEDNARCGMRYLAKFYRQGGEHYAALRYHGGPNTRMHGIKTRAYAAAVARPSAPPRWAGTLLAWN